MVKFLIIFLLLFSAPIPTFAQEKIVNPKKSYTYEILEEDICQLKARYGQNLSTKTIGESFFGKKIFAVKLGKGNNHILMVGAHHGREWITSALIMNMIESYVEAYQESEKIGSFSSAILDEVSIWFVPMLNPDGVEIQQIRIENSPSLMQHHLLLLNEGNSNFLRWKANGQGIDLNRQYPAGWSELPDEPLYPTYQFYKGKKPFEAKEVQALGNFTKKVNPLIATAYHSSGREIFWKYNNKFLERDKKLACKLSSLTGYELSMPSPEATGGGYTDWFITSYQRPGFTIEICPSVKETSPSLSFFDEEWERNKFVGIFLANQAKKMAEGTN